MSSLRRFGGDLLPYVPPTWATSLQSCPRYRIKLAQLPTPIVEWNVPGITAESGVNVCIKRDDMTASDLSGSKIRKMEFVMASALEKKCDSVVTTGGLHSNHCRTVAVISRQLGLQPHLLLRSPKKDIHVDHRGNLLLDRLVGSQIVLCETSPEVDCHVIEKRMTQYVENLRTKGANPFSIPLNQVDIVGFWGYIELFQELLEQEVLTHFDHIFVAVASCGTVLGMALGNYLTGSHLKIHGICACETADHFYSESDRYLEQLGLSRLCSRDLMELIDGYIGLGYSISTEAELDFLRNVSSQTGVLLDRIYTVKAAKGMLTEINEKLDIYKNKRVLFIHTGGIHTLHDGQLEGLLDCTETNQVCTMEQYII